MMEMEGPLKFIPSKASSLKKKSEAGFQAVFYESYKSKNPKKATKTGNEEPVDGKESKEFNIRQAKQEVIKFGTSGFDSQTKKAEKINLLIKLGAKPPKNKNKNYKLLQAERKTEKQKQAERKQFQQLGKNAIGKSNAKGKSFDRKRRKEKDDLLGTYGKVKVLKKT
ncbi:uncharacterized protein [Leptinotarsa decemlineata]|uniref:uncharacterized protein n=1 Tax=Leptinotarsa decemlineata TaxID=7539 RepID=UPI003D30B09F